jgi:hypothetical protein
VIPTEPIISENKLSYNINAFNTNSIVLFALFLKIWT